MLDGLDGIDWEKMEHAYGSAADVPGQLRALASGDAGAREEAMGALWSNVVHQGTVYEATSYAVPFLIELVASPDTANKNGILALLSGMASGSSYTVAHADIDRSIGYNDVGSPEWHAKAQTELGWVGAAHLAVVARVPTYLDLLRDATGNDSVTRAAATYVLADCAERAAEILPVLTEGITAETDPAVQASRLLAAFHLARRVPTEGDSSPHDSVVEAAGRLFDAADSSPLVRTVAALTLLRSDGTNVPDATVPHLQETLRNPDAVASAYRALIWSDGDGIAATVSGALARRKGADTQDTVSLMLDAIPTGTDWDSVSEATGIAQAVISLLDLEVRNPNPFEQNRLPAVPSELTPFQRDTLLRLCDTFDRWEMVDGNLVLTFRVYGLPDPRELRHFLTASE